MKKITADAIVDTGFGLGNIAASTAILATNLPGWLATGAFFAVSAAYFAITGIGYNGNPSLNESMKKRLATGWQY